MQAPSIFENVAVLTELLAWLSPSQLLRLRLVCHRWRQVADREYVWWRMAQRLGIRGSVDVERENKWREEARAGNENYFVPPPRNAADTWKRLVMRAWCPHVEWTVEQCLEWEERWRERRERLGHARCGGCNVLNCWMCVHCGVMACGRTQKGHMLEHHGETRKTHTVVIQTRDLLVWCFCCDRYLGEEDCSDAERLRVLLMKRSLLNQELFQHRVENWRIREECQRHLTHHRHAPARYE